MGDAQEPNDAGSEEQAAPQRFVRTHRYTDRTGRPRRKYVYGPTPELADEALEEFKTRLKTEPAPPGGPRTVAALMRAWLTEKHPERPASKTWRYIEKPVQAEQWADYQSVIATHIATHPLARRQLTAVTDSDLGKFFEELATTESQRGGILSVSMQRKVHSRLTSAFRYAERKRWIDRDPMLEIPTPTELPGLAHRDAEIPVTERALRVEERLRFERHIADRYPDHRAYRLRWWIAFELGLRQAECLGLTWDCIDLRERTITVRQQLKRRRFEHGCGEPVRGVTACTAAARETHPRAKAIPASRCPRRVAGAWEIVATTKNKRVRTVRFTPAMAAELAALYAEQHPVDAPALGPVEAKRLARERRKARYDVADADLVIRTPRGGHVSKGLDNTEWHRVVIGAGISTRGRDVHAARHTAATTMVRAGVPLTTVREILGHSNISVTLQYVTTTGDAQDEALAAVTAYIAGRS